MPSFSDCKSGHAWLICQRKGSNECWAARGTSVQCQTHRYPEAQPNLPHLGWLNASEFSKLVLWAAEKKSLAKFMRSFPRISCKLNSMSFGDNRKLCWGAPVSMVTPLPGAFPREAHRGRKDWWNWVTSLLLSFSAQVRSRKATVPNPNCLSAKCQSRDHVEGPHLGADLQTWTGLGKESRNGHFRHSFISWCCKLLRQRCKTVF